LGKEGKERTGEERRGKGREKGKGKGKKKKGKINNYKLLGNEYNYEL